jgi:hypothetical protein
MHTPSVPALLDAWESGLGKDFARCGLALLAAACPDAAVDTLAELSIGERDRRLLLLREAVFGPRMNALATCARCGEAVEFELTASDLRSSPPVAEGTPALTVDHDDWHLELRVLNSHDLIVAADAPERAEAMLFARALRVARHAGTPVESAAVPDAVRAAAAASVAAADAQADLQLALTCASCGFAWQAPLDIVAFLWAELDAWASRTLREVHMLAAAYGWAEREILALAPARRRHYLRLVGG